jgi:thioredoxin reductase (NADPH)
MAIIGGIPGGALATIDRMEDFPGFPDGIAGYVLGPALQQQSADAGAEFMMGEANRLTATQDGGWLVGITEGEIQARTVIIATGSRPRALGVPGEERLRGKGISHCASCDGPLLRGRPAVVVGGGDSGLQEALTLAPFASEVLVVERSEQPTAQAVYRQRCADEPGIRLRTQTTIAEFVGDDRVTGVRLRDTMTGEPSEYATERVFVYVGLEPNTAFVPAGVRDGDGRIVTDPWMRTSERGLLAAGDVRRDSAGQAVTAAGDGATAAIAAVRYLHTGAWQ